ncbi:MAG: YraN family protein [Rhizobiaceae bacterium]|nr:YraN family protein [Rhizobiaceae bacterium]
MTYKRRQAYRRGHQAEWLAAIMLQLNGFRIAARRFKTPVGEVDLIVRKQELIVFVEVKARSSHQVALDSINPTSQRRIAAAAMWWLGQQPDAGHLSWRFDVITVAPRSWPRHFKDVW